MKYLNCVPLFVLTTSTHCTRLRALTGKQITSPGCSIEFNWGGVNQSSPELVAHNHLKYSNFYHLFLKKDTFSVNLPITLFIDRYNGLCIDNAPF